MALSLRAARVNAGYTQKEAANLLKVSNKTLSSWEQGNSYPKPPMINKICELYNLAYDEIRFTN